MNNDILVHTELQRTFFNSVKREINFSSLERFGLTKRPTSLIHCKNGIRNIQNEVSKLKRTNSESFLLKQSIEKLGSLPSNNKKNTINIKSQAWFV